MSISTPSATIIHLWPKCPRLHDHNSRSVHLFETRRVPVQRAVEQDEISYPYKVHDTTLRPLLDITKKSTIVVRSRSRSCGGDDICGTTTA